jgi:hypothetical protein
MSQRFEIDLEQERVQVDGAWLSVAEISQKITLMISAGDRKIGRLAEAMEQLDQAVAGARSVTLKLSAEHFARLEAAGQKLGMSASAFARDLLMQVLSSAPAIAPAPAAIAAPSPAQPVSSDEPSKRLEPAPVVLATAAEPTLDESAQALTMPSRRRDPLPASPPATSSVAAPAAPVAEQPSVVIDLGAGEEKPRLGAPNDGRRWFHRTT